MSPAHKRTNATTQIRNNLFSNRKKWAIGNYVIPANLDLHSFENHKTNNVRLNIKFGEFYFYLLYLRNLVLLILSFQKKIDYEK